MEKKQAKKAPAPKKKTASKSAPKKKVVKKELPIIAPEATPFVAHYEEAVTKAQAPSFWSKVKSLLGF